MQAIELVGPRDVRQRTREQPSFGPEEVLVEITHVGICGSDRHWYEHGRMGDRVVENPLVLGHESAGRLVESGSNVSGFSSGDRVAIEPGVPCGSCEFCRSGRYNLCPDVEFMATPGTDGALRDYVAWPAEYVHQLPASVSLREGALCEPASVGLHAVRRAEVDPGDSAAVVGGGPIGLISMMVARAAGAAELSIVDIVEDKLHRARELGVDHAFDGTRADLATHVAETVVDAPDVVIEASGSQAGVETAVSLAGRDGTVVLVGLAPAAEVPLRPFDLVRNQVDIRTSYRFANTYADVLSMIAADRIEPNRLVDFELPFSEIESAFRRLETEPVIKGVVGLDRSS